MPIWVRGLCVCVGSKGCVFLCCARVGPSGCISMFFSEGCVGQCCVLRVVCPCWFLRGVLSVCVGSEVCMFSVGSEGCAPILGEGCVSLLVLRCLCAPVLDLRGVCPCVVSEGCMHSCWVLRDFCAQVVY